jgi:hypothetical protein
MRLPHPTKNAKISSTYVPLAIVLTIAVLALGVSIAVRHGVPLPAVLLPVAGGVIMGIAIALLFDRARVRRG